MEVHALFTFYFKFSRCFSYYFFHNEVTRYFSSYCFTSIFTSADLIFHNFLELFIQHYLKQRFFHECASLKFSSLACKTGFYRPKRKAKARLYGTEFWRSWNAKIKCSSRYSSNSRWKNTIFIFDILDFLIV